MLGCALGFSTNQLDGLNAHSPDAPLADKMLEVLRVAHAHYGNTPTFVNALMTALQSPIVSAPHLASELAKGTAKLAVKMKMISYVCSLSRFWCGRMFSNSYIKWQ